MEFIKVISRVITLLLFATFGFFLLFFCKAIIEKADQKIPDRYSLPKTEKVAEGFVSIREEMPRFPGCEDIEDRGARSKCSQQKMLKYIYGEIKYPVVTEESTIGGTIVVRFYIDEEGNVKSPEILKSIGSEFDEEVLRVIRKMSQLPDKWIPGSQRGKAVKVYFNLPIKILLK